MVTTANPLLRFTVGSSSSKTLAGTPALQKKPTPRRSLVVPIRFHSKFAPFALRLEGAEERYQVLLLLRRQLGAEDQVEKLHGIVQGQ